MIGIIPQDQDAFTAWQCFVYNCAMLILTHEKADFDAVASQLGAQKLFPHSVALLPNQLNRNVQRFLNLYWDALPFMRAGDWRRQRVDSIVLVDTHTLANVRGMAKEPAVQVIDHHTGYHQRSEWTYEVESVGATVTMLVEKLQAGGIVLSPEEATLLILGIYEDTGALTYDTTTSRDVRAAAWLLEQGALLSVARRFINVALSPAQQNLYDALVLNLEWIQLEGRPILLARAEAPPGFNDEISTVAHLVRETFSPEGLFVMVQMSDGVQVVARSMSDEIDAGLVARQLGGGGHSRASAAMVVGGELDAVHTRLLDVLPLAVKPMLTVADLMSRGVQTVDTTATVADAAALMTRVGHEGYPVLDTKNGRVVGLLTRRGVDRAMSHEMESASVRRVMKPGNITLRPSDSVERVQELMAEEGWGQIPVLPEAAASEETDGDHKPIGIVTRTDLINLLFQPSQRAPEVGMSQLLASSLSPPLWAMVRVISRLAGEQRMPLYLVGGLVRDLLLDKLPADLDIVVEGDAIQLVKALQAEFGGEVHSHERFGTAKWILSPEMWESIEAAAEPVLSMLDQGRPLSDPNATPEPPVEPPVSIDFVTARKEFYKRPTALPDVERGSIKLDLHRRDFTINTLAIRLDGDFLGQLLDFYGGRRDLDRGLIRVLHSLSFIDDPTRILRAIRLEQRLGFQIEPGTLELVTSALPLLDRVTGARVRHELEQALAEPDPVAVLGRMGELQVLQHIHPDLRFTPQVAALFANLTRFRADPLWSEILELGPEIFYIFALWLARYSREMKADISHRLQVRKATQDDLLAAHDMNAALRRLPYDAPPSIIAHTIRPYSNRALLAVRLQVADGPIPAWLDHYRKEWKNISSEITGNDLREMGLDPGPAYTRLLSRLLDARLDGEVSDRTGEQRLLESMLAEEKGQN